MPKLSLPPVTDDQRRPPYYQVPADIRQQAAADLGETIPLTLHQDPGTGATTLKILEDQSGRPEGVYRRNKDGFIEYHGPCDASTKPNITGSHQDWPQAPVDRAMQMLMARLLRSQDLDELAQFATNQSRADETANSIIRTAGAIASECNAPVTLGRHQEKVVPSTFQEKLAKAIQKHITDPAIVKLCAHGSPKSLVTIDAYNFAAKHQAALKETEALNPGIIALWLKTSAQAQGPRPDQMTQAIATAMGLKTPNQQLALATALSSGLCRRPNIKNVAAMCLYAGQKTPAYAGQEKPPNITPQALACVSQIINRLPDPLATGYNMRYSTRNAIEHWTNLTAIFVRDHDPAEHEEDLQWLTKHAEACGKHSAPFHPRPDQHSWAHIKQNFLPVPKEKR